MSRPIGFILLFLVVATTSGIASAQITSCDPAQVNIQWQVYSVRDAKGHVQYVVPQGAVGSVITINGIGRIPIFDRNDGYPTTTVPGLRIKALEWIPNMLGAGSKQRFDRLQQRIAAGEDFFIALYNPANLDQRLAIKRDYRLPDCYEKALVKAGTYHLKSAVEVALSPFVVPTEKVWAKTVKLMTGPSGIVWTFYTSDQKEGTIVGRAYLQITRLALDKIEQQTGIFVNYVATGGVGDASVDARHITPIRWIK